MVATPPVTHRCTCLKQRSSVLSMPSFPLVVIHIAAVRVCEQVMVRTYDHPAVTLPAPPLHSWRACDTDNHLCIPSILCILCGAEGLGTFFATLLLLSHRLARAATDCGEAPDTQHGSPISGCRALFRSRACSAASAAGRLPGGAGASGVRAAPAAGDERQAAASTCRPDCPSWQVLLGCLMGHSMLLMCGFDGAQHAADVDNTASLLLALFLNVHRLPPCSATTRQSARQWLRRGSSLLSAAGPAERQQPVQQRQHQQPPAAVPAAGHQPLHQSARSRAVQRHSMAHPTGRGAAGWSVEPSAGSGRAALCRWAAQVGWVVGGWWWEQLGVPTCLIVHAERGAAF